MKISGAVFHKSQKLTEDQLMPAHLHCPLCAAATGKTSVCLQDDPEVTLIECSNCKAASASRMPTEEAIEEFYEGYYATDSALKTGERVTFDVPGRIGRRIATIANRYRGPYKIRILDFGGGDGSISYQVAQQLIKFKDCDVDILLIDYNETVIVPKNKHIRLSRESTLETARPGYDIVIASAILEHLTEPGETLAMLLNLLNSNGIFYARTPYVLPFIKLCNFLNIQWDFTFPAHLHDLGQEFWESYFNRMVSPSDFTLLRSTPSLVQTNFAQHPFRTLAAHALKAHWYLLGRRYPYVGGWEVFVKRNTH